MSESATVTKHDQAMCIRDVRLTYYNGRSYNGTFRCPTCGREGRINLNYLGRHARVVCRGDKKLHIERA